MKFIVLLGRVLFSLIFLRFGFNHFSSQTIHYASSKGVPFATILVPIAGIIVILGALSIMLGSKAKLGAWLIVLFLVPVTLMMHNFWTESDPMMRQVQLGMFMKNTSMLGAALMITYLGSGPLSIDNKSK